MGNLKAAALAAAFLGLAGSARAYVPPAAPSCVEGCASSGGGYGNTERSSYSGGGNRERDARPSEPSWLTKRRWAKQAARQAERQSEALKLMCRFEDQACASVPATTPIWVGGGTPLFCQENVKPWLASRLSDAALAGTPRSSEALRRCMAVLRFVVAIGPESSPEDASFLADQAAAALEGQALRVAIPAGDGAVPPETVDKLADGLKSLAEGVRRSVEAVDALQEAESQALSSRAGGRSLEELESLSAAAQQDELFSPAAEESAGLQAAKKNVDVVLEALAKDEDIVCRIVGTERCK
jgi:hypothetical protein